MLATILDDTWNVLNMQHITLLKDPPTHMFEGDHHLRNRTPNPPPVVKNKYESANCIQKVTIE